MEEPVHYGSIHSTSTMRRSTDSSSDDQIERELEEDDIALQPAPKSIAVDTEQPKRLTRSRVYALIAVCTLSVGSHLWVLSLRSASP